MEHTLTYEETIDDSRIYVVAGCDCGWVWRDNGIVGYNETDVQIGARSHHREHLTAIGEPTRL